MKMIDGIKSKNVDELAEWLDKYGILDNSPWITWFDKAYCKKCNNILMDGVEYAWCELNNKCRFFQDSEESPDTKQIIKMWLQSEE